MIKAVIIDDETHALEALKWELNEHCPDVEIVATTTTPLEGIKLLYEHQPDILFLDIEMPRMNGFELLSTINSPSFAVIFTTAYDEFAIKAIKVSAFDYLLKPIDSDELVSAVEKYKAGKAENQSDQLESLLKSISTDKNKVEKIPLPHSGGTDFINQNDIYFCESSGNYTHIYLKEKKILISKTLKHLEQLLNPSVFIRVHHSYIVNSNHVTQYIKGEGGELVLSNGAAIKVSRSRKEQVLQQLNVISAK